jgi:hypothetical protein
MTFIVGDSSTDPEKMPQQSFVLLRSIIERFEVFTRNHEHMRGRLGIDIANYHTTLILVDEITRDFTCNNSTKQAAQFRHFSETPLI